MENEKLNIAICDDDIGCCKKLSAWLSDDDIAKKVYYTTESLLEDMRAGVRYDIIFLDIDFEGTSGIEAGQEIRSYIRRDQVNIVFISGKQGYAMELFEIEPLNFHVKPLNMEKILRDVEKVRRRIDERKIKLRYKNYEGVQKEIEVGDIVYIQSQRGTLTIHTCDGETDSFQGALSRLEKLHNSVIGYQCHQSYWVNMSYVKKFLYQKFTLYDGTEIKVGRKYKEEMKKKWIQYRKARK